MIVMQNLKINEIFYSIQGEGNNVGMSAVFVRLAGCNLECSFCDTDFSEKHDINIDAIMKQIKKYKCKNVVITGGEPFYQDIYSLLAKLYLDKFYVCVETNGTYEINDNYSRYIDWLTISPKTNWVQKIGNELKVVYQGQDLKQYENNFFRYHYLQPCSMQNINETVEAVKKNKIWRLSLQTQKMIGVR